MVLEALGLPRSKDRPQLDTFQAACMSAAWYMYVKVTFIQWLTPKMISLFFIQTLTCSGAQYCRAYLITFHALNWSENNMERDIIVCDGNVLNSLHIYDTNTKRAIVSSLYVPFLPLFQWDLRDPRHRLSPAHQQNMHGLLANHTDACTYKLT